MEQKELAIQLIKDDLIHYHLLNSFELIGFYSEDYSLSLSDTIFKVLEIDDKNDELFELYLEKCWKIIEFHEHSDRAKLRVRAEEVYNFLMGHISNNQ